MKTWIVVLLAIAMAGCSRKITTTKSETFDSTNVRETLRMIPIRVPGEVVFANTRPLPCDPITLLPRPVVVEAKGRKAKAKAEIKPDGHLEVSGGCEAQDSTIAAKDREIFRLRNEKKETVTPEYRTRKIDIFCRWFTGINILLLIVSFVLWVKKKLPFFKLPFIG